VWQGVRENAEQLTGIRDWAEAFFATALVFEPLELMVLALSTAVFAYLSLDGESHWLEGVLLLALYLMTAVVFFLDPLTG